MTEQKPCLPECLCGCEIGSHQPANECPTVDAHAPACPNAPKPPEAPKVENCVCDHPEKAHSSDGCLAEDAHADGNFCPCLSDHAKPAPAPEPKQGSEEPIDQFEAYHRAMWLCERSDMSDAEINLSRAYLALRAEVEEFAREYIRRRDKSGRWGEERAALRAEVEKLKQEAAQWKDLHDSCHPSQERLRAELAQAREELAKLRGERDEARQSYICETIDLRSDIATEKAARERAEDRVKELEDMISVQACNDGNCITVPHAYAICAEARAILARKGESK